MVTFEQSSSAAALGKARTLTDQVARALREAIFRGELAPGEALRQDDLAEQLGVSRIPVREALRALAGEGLVELRAHRGALVRPVSLEEARELVELRVLLEAEALRLCIPKKTDTLVRTAEHILRGIEREPDVIRRLEMGMQFWHTLYEPMERPMLLSFIDLTLRSTLRYTALAAGSRELRAAAQDLYRGILDRYRKGDAEGAGRILRRQLLLMLDTITERIPGEEIAPDDAEDDDGARASHTRLTPARPKSVPPRRAARSRR